MVKSIEVDEEEDSIDISVTMGTREINYTASIMEEIEERENQPETSSIKSFQTMNEDYFKNLFKEDMTLDQKEKLAMASLNQTFRKLISSKQIEQNPNWPGPNKKAPLCTGHNGAEILQRARLFLILLFDNCLGCREACDGHTVRRATYVIQTGFNTEFN